MSHRDDQRKQSGACARSWPMNSQADSCPAVAYFLITLLGVLGLLAVVSPATPQAAPKGESPQEAQSCLASQCHEYRMAFWKSPHSALDTEGLASRADATWSCAACHGEPKKRDKAPGEPGCQVDVFSFLASEAPHVRSERCLACHATDHPDFDLSPHARAGLDCTTCHAVHEDNPGRWPLQRKVTEYDGDALRTEASGTTCVGCHADVFADFEQNERHRLQEGVLVCTDCHDPHRRQSRLLLGGFKQEACAKCHRDKIGPFVFEHAAVRVEGCVTCHTPHGTPNRHTLAFQQVAELCFSCHPTVPGFHTRFTLDTQCTNCHSTIHGSNLDSHFLK